jgi:hypothetical protein
MTTTPLRRGGEVSSGRPKSLPDGKTSATASEIGFTSKQIHEARIHRYVEIKDPGVIRRALDERTESGEYEVQPIRVKITGAMRTPSPIGCGGGGDHGLAIQVHRY